MRILHTLPLTVTDWPFDITVTRHFWPKSGHSDGRAYCKRIDRATIPELWFSYNQFCCFLDKKCINIKKDTEKRFVTKQKFPQSPKCTKKYSFEYNAYRAVIKDI